MTSLATLLRSRTMPYSTRSYAAFRVCEIGELYLDRDGRRTIYPPNTYELPIGDVASLDQALTAALTCGKTIYHKERLVIRETDERGMRLHVYAVRKRKAAWVHPAGETLPRRVEDLYADPICVIDAGVLA